LAEFSIKEEDKRLVEDDQGLEGTLKHLMHLAGISESVLDLKRS